MAPRKKADQSESSDTRALVVKGCKIWMGEDFIEGSILIEDGKISKIGKTVRTDIKSMNGRGLLALPGLIDVHVHLRDMDFSYKEDFTSGTSAAAAGGFTSILDMPNSRPPVDSPNRLVERVATASKKILVNVGFHAAAVRDVQRLRGMARLGAFSLKLYMPHPISPLRVDDDEEVLAIMRESARSDLPVTVHAEEPKLLGDSSAAKTWVGLARTQPDEAESHAVKRMLRLQSSSGCSMHFAHITLPTSLRSIRSRQASVVTSEVTPHHLMLSESDLTRLKWRAWMVPPLRATRLVRKLLEATSQGMATLFASDHAPHTVDEKRAGLQEVLPGVPGLETTLPLLLTLVHRGRISMKRMVDMLTIAPARTFKIPSRGRLVEGAEGDLTLVNPSIVAKVNPRDFLSKAKYSPFEGFETRGRVEATIVGGQIVFQHGRIVAREGTGRILKKRR